jgi:hypothetical protein
LVTGCDILAAITSTAINGICAIDASH